MIDVIPLQMAKQLVADGVVSEIEKEPIPFSVVFGKEGARSRIDYFIKGAGLIDKVYVTPDVRVALISDVTFTDKGITIVKTADHIWGISSLGAVAFTGWRDRSKSSKSLWVTELSALLRAPSHQLQIQDKNSNLLLCSVPMFGQEAIEFAEAATVQFFSGDGESKSGGELAACFFCQANIFGV